MVDDFRECASSGGAHGVVIYVVSAAKPTECQVAFIIIITTIIGIPLSSSFTPVSCDGLSASHRGLKLARLGTHWPCMSTSRFTRSKAEKILYGSTILSLTDGDIKSDSFASHKPQCIALRRVKCCWWYPSLKLVFCSYPIAHGVYEHSTGIPNWSSRSTRNGRPHAEAGMTAAGWSNQSRG